MSQAYGSVFARVYDKKWGGFVKNAGPAIIDFYNTHGGISGGRILDICCGTGQLAKILLDRGFEVTGIDLSEDMLHHSRGNCAEYVDQGKADFVHANAKDFELEGNFDLAVSTFDALNHLETISDLKSCFDSTHRSLKKNGYFIFDLNTRKGLEYNWNSMSFSDDEDTTFLIKGIFMDHENRGITSITGFVKNADGFYEKFHEVIYNTVFGMEDVRNRLHESGFEDVCFSCLPDLNKRYENPDELNRVFVIAKK